MSKWPTVNLSEVLQLQRRWLKPDPMQTYREIGVRSFGKGIFHKTPVEGSVLGNKRVLRIEPGDLVFNNVFAWEGAVAIAGTNETGMIGSHRFVTYRVDPSKATAEFLKLFFTTPRGLELLLKASPGSAGRNKTLGLDRFIGQSIPLPPPVEQRRVVARIEELASQIHEARTLRHHAAEGVEAILRSIIARDKQARTTPMRDLVNLRLPDVTVRPDETYQFAGVYCFGRGVFKAARKSGMDFAYRRLTRLRAGEFVYPKLMAWEGALGVVPSECDGCVVSTEFPVFQVNEDRVLHEVLDTYFRTPSVWPQIAGESTGTNVRRRRLNPQDFLNYEMPLPSRETQMILRKVKAEVDALKRLQAETAAELDALLPALLDRAFKGEL